MKVSDLRNYVNDGGCFLFVVYINPVNTQQTKIYYSALTPIKLEKILENVSKQKNKSLKLKAFPTENAKKEIILKNFYMDSKRQTSFSLNDCIQLDQIGKIDKIEGGVAE